MRRLMILFIGSLLVVGGCTRRPLSDSSPCGSSANSALIAVSVDWSSSGFETSDNQFSGDEYVHRVSFRFFPTDGSEPFERYLEDNVWEGEIYVPVGEYSVVVYNESINDIYWEESITFVDSDNYDLFAAIIADQAQDLYDFYTPDEDENLSVEALRLASCSVEGLVISQAMADATRSDLIEALNPVVPLPLTCITTIDVDIENLSSAYSVHASLSGLAQRVFMATGDTDIHTTTHVGELTSRQWHDDDEQHGIISESRLTFSTPNSSSSTHLLTLDIMLVDGSHHEPDEELVFDVSDQITSAVTRYADTDLGASASVSLPSVSGDIEVAEWGDESKIEIL